MKRRLVLVHGRAQQRKDPATLKAEWLDALGKGLGKSNLILPIPESDVRFPFYGDTLDDMVNGRPADEAADVIVRGNEADTEEKDFTLAIVEEIRKKAGVSKEQVAAVAGQDAVEKGPQNWGWVQAVLQAVDQFVPNASASGIALFTHDVFLYLNEPVIRRKIDEGVSAALADDTETVVVGHSLGTVVAYNILRQLGSVQGWRVPLYATVGSPLAVTAIRKELKKKFGRTRCPECVSAWFNAMDDRDVVALYPLDPDRFPLDPTVPEIKNKTDVLNETPNRHGISGYLADKDVAKAIHDALTAG